VGGWHERSRGWLAWPRSQGPRDAEFVLEDYGQAATILLVNAAMLRITRRRAHPKIWIDDALGGTARCRRTALRQRGEVTFDAIPKYAEGLHADRVARVIRLSSNWRGHKNRRSYQNRQNRCAHHDDPSFGAVPHRRRAGLRGLLSSEGPLVTMVLEMVGSLIQVKLAVSVIGGLVCQPSLAGHSSPAPVGSQAARRSVGSTRDGPNPRQKVDPNGSS